MQAEGPRMSGAGGGAWLDARGPRLGSVDRLRGLVIVLMALDHARDFFSFYPYSSTDLTRASAALFLTRWVTHLCAPIFFLLTGTGAGLYARNAGVDRAALQRYLVTRGLWLVLLEITWNNLAWRFDLHGLQVQVLWALGWSMVALAAAVWLPAAGILALGLLIVGGHDLLDGVAANSLGPDWSAGATLWRLLHEPWITRTADGFEVAELYPLIPWVGVMMLGYALVPVLQWPAQKRDRFLLGVGAGVVILFLALRLTNGYGESAPHRFGGGTVFGPNPRGVLFTVLSALNLTKYPPSLQYLLMTLGPAMLLLPWLERWSGGAGRVLTLFGRVPMFFYLLHVPLLHLAGGIYGYLRYGPAILKLDPMNPVLPGYAPSLVPPYIAWLLVVAALYPACRWYAGFKQRNARVWWTRYV